MIDSTDARVIELALRTVPGQGDHQLDQPGGRRGALRARGAAGPHATARRWWSAASTRTSSRAWRSPASASWPSPSAPTSSSPTSTASPEGHDLRPARLPVRHRRRELHRLRGRDHRGRPRSSRSASPDARPSSASPTSPSACPTAGREVLNSVFLYHCAQGGPRPAIVNSREARALRLDPGGGAEARRGPDLLARRRTRSPPSRRTSAAGSREAAKETGAQLPLDERLARYIIEGTKDGLLDDLDLKLEEPSAARHHQRPADDGHGRGRPPLQRQRAHRRRGAPVRRGDEGRRRATSSRTWRRTRARSRGNDRARHGQGRRPRHRQEPGRDHPREQRLPGRQPRHQGAAGGPDRARTTSTSRTRSASPGCW